MTPKQPKECCAVARQRTRTAPERASRARSAGTPLAALLASLEGILIVSLASTYLRSLGGLAGSLTPRKGEAKPPAPAPVPALAPAATATKSPTARPVRKVVTVPEPVPLFPPECYSDDPEHLKAWHITNMRNRKVQLAALYGDSRFPRALQVIMRHAGDDRKMPRVGGRNAWDVVTECDPELAASLRKLGRDPQEWKPLLRDVKQTQMEAARAAGQKTASARQARQDECKRAGVAFVDTNPDAMGMDVTPAARRVLRFAWVEAFGHCAQHRWAGRSPEAQEAAREATLDTVGLVAVQGGEVAADLDLEWEDEADGKQSTGAQAMGAALTPAPPTIGS